MKSVEARYLRQGPKHVNAENPQEKQGMKKFGKGKSDVGNKLSGKNKRHGEAEIDEGRHIIVHSPNDDQYHLMLDVQDDEPEIGLGHEPKRMKCRQFSKTGILNYYNFLHDIEIIVQLIFISSCRR